MMENRDHWENIYLTRTATELSWHQEHPRRSLHFIQRTGVGKAAQIIDVGGGTSTLTAELLASGFVSLTVLDISPTALQTAQERLGAKAAAVTWFEADILQARLSENYYDVWHDRAVFHFLTQPAERQRYVRAVLHSLKPGGHLILATFALDGPPRCSGLEVMRYSPESLHAEFGSDFELVDSDREVHTTPSGTEQHFIYCWLRRRSEAS